MNIPLIVNTARILLTAVAAAVVLAACNDSAQMAEQWPAAPRPTPTPGAVLILPTPEASALADEAYAALNTLTMQYSPRESGTDQELDAALYLQKNLDALGYDTSLQEFDTPHIIWADVHLTSDDGKPLMNTERSHLHPGAVTMSAGSATGLLTFVGEALNEDIPDEGLNGRIALMEHGASAFDEQIRRVTKAGAAGAMVLTTEDHLFGALSPYGPQTIPVISAYSGGSHGSALLRLIQQEEVTAAVAVNERKLFSQNVVATMRGSEDIDRPQRRVILGAHYDTATNSQGASDNGSGLAALLTVARHVAERDYPFDIRIVLFGAEEFGLFGSERYVERMSHYQEIDSTIAMLNFDALGSGNSLTVSGDFDLTSEAIDIGRELGASISLEGGGMSNSDHAPFQEAGIPTLFLSSSDISRINSPEDTIEHINPDLLGYAAEIGIAMLDSLADEMR